MWKASGDRGNSSGVYRNFRVRRSVVEMLLSKLMKQRLALLTIFVLFQNGGEAAWYSATPIKRGAFTTADGCRGSALGWARTLQLGEGKEVLELNDGYLVRTDRRAVELRCRRQK